MKFLDILIVAAVVILFGLALWKTLSSFRKGKCTGCGACDCNCSRCAEKKNQ